MKPLVCADLFAGAGGTSQGLSRACLRLGRALDLTAVNHWPTAVETHAANHPGARHLCEGLDGVDPRRLFAGRRLDLLCASPECTHHSTARGGKPVDDQSRATAWHVVRWADALRPRAVVVENVKEFATWGPLAGRAGALRPDPRRKGETFAAWLGALSSLGYRVSHRVLCAADYGDATTRERLFVVALRGRSAFRWPEPTHARAPSADLYGAGLRPWRAAREVIDWALKGRSIFGRAKPLKDTTLARIEAGLRRFGGAEFVAHVTHSGERRAHGAGEPLPTLTGSRELALVEPFVLGQQSLATPRAVSEPLPTVAAAGAISLTQAEAAAPERLAYLVSYYGTGGPRDLGEPLDTVTARDRFGLVEACRRGGIDLLFRMLAPHELAAAHGFPAGYRFLGSRTDHVRMVGNSVPVGLSDALCGAALVA